MVSVLIGVASAAGVHLVWWQPSGTSTDLASAHSGIPGGEVPAGGGAEPATSTVPGDEPVATGTSPSEETADAGGDTDPAESTPASTELMATPTTEPTATPDTESTSTPAPGEAESTDGSVRPRTANASLRRQVVAQVNDERERVGCGPVRVDHRLTTAAQRHSDDMARQDYLAHTSPDGGTFDERMEAAGYPRPAAENIAMGMSAADAVMDAWMDSESHRRNILDCDITAIGVGVNSSGWYWTQNFGY